MKLNRIRIGMAAFAIIALLPSITFAQATGTTVPVTIYPDSVLNDVSNHPVGINLDYFMDNDNYLHPKRRLADALKAMGVKYLRYPGGNKSDFYFFSRPPYDKSIPTLARTGPGAVDGRNRALNATATDFKNVVLNFDEYMDVCHETGAEPVIVVAGDEYLVDYPAGSTWSTRDQLIKNAVEWVRYANIKKHYHIKYWMIANETWNSNNKNSNVDIYAQDVIDFSKAMKAVDPSIMIIPNGNSDSWWKTILTKDAGYIDAICLSNYPFYQLPHGFASYRDSVLDFLPPVKTALNAINKYATTADKAKLKVIAAESGPFDWGGDDWAFRNTMATTLANFELMGQQLQTPGLLFSCFWNTRWITNDSLKYAGFDALDKDGNFNAVAYSIMIWGKYLNAKMVKTTATIHLRSYASYSPDKKTMFVYLVNKSANDIIVRPRIIGHNIKAITQAWELTGTGPEDVSPVWRKADAAKGDQHVKGTSIKVIEYSIN